MKDSIKRFFRQYLCYGAIALISAAYILTAFLMLDKTGKTIPRIIADGVISFLVGIFISRMFDLQGILTGDDDEKVQQTESKHETAVIEVSPYIEALDDWCDDENKKNYKRQRTIILARAGLKYSDCFDDDGIIKDWQPNEANLKNRVTRRIEMRKLRGFKKAVMLKLTSLSANELTSEGGRQNDPFYLGRSKMQYEKQRNSSDMISKVVMALIVGYYSVSLIKEFNIANLIWIIFQVSMFISIGVIKMYEAENFVKGEYKNRIGKKTWHLKRFEVHAGIECAEAPTKENTENLTTKEEIKNG